MMVFLLVVTTILGLWFRWRYVNRHLIKLAKTIPGPPALPIVGNAHKFLGYSKDTSVMEVLKEMIGKYGDVFKLWLGKELNVVVCNLDDIKILLTNPQTSVKGPQYKYMAEITGGGILSGSGETWRKHRKIAIPNCSKWAIESYIDVFNTEIDLLIEELKKINGRLDIYEYIVQTTSNIVCQTLLGLTKEETMTLPGYDIIVKETPRLYDIVFDRMTKWFLQIDPAFRLTNSNKIMKKFNTCLREFCKTIIKHRLNKLSILNLCQQNCEKESLENIQLSVIDRFLLSNEFDTKEIVTETFTIFTTSQEASAKIASFILLMSAYHPECQERLYAEIIHVLGGDEKEVTSEDLKHMPYLDMVFKEVLRLFPIAVMLQRTITEDITISSYTLPAGCSLVVPIYHIHRDPRFWDNPDDFDPERFTLENTKARPANCYLPFSMGPMDCIGRHFATRLVKTMVVKTLQEFKITATDRYKDMVTILAISTTTANGFPVILTKRNM